MNDDPIKISVIVPVYKVEPYLEKCVDSLLRQTYRNIDIILVDDGSPDNCPAMCDRFARENENVTALHKKNGGLGDARNYGVKQTENEWIVFVDSDDYVEPEYVQTMVDLKDQFDADLVITRIRREPEDASAIKTNNKFPSVCLDRSAALTEAYRGGKVGWAACGKLFKRSVLLAHPFPDGYYEDCACMYRIIDDSEKIAIGDFENNYHYIQRSGSILASRLNEKHLHIFDITKEFEAYIRQNHPDKEILIVHFYRRAVVQLLVLQSMDEKTFREIFLRYRPMFRNDFRKVMRDGATSKKTKAVYALLCGSPDVFRFLLNRLKQ